jgi:hypothetical protein
MVKSVFWILIHFTAAATIAHLGPRYSARTEVNILVATAAYAAVRSGLVYTRFGPGDHLGREGSDFVRVPTANITQAQVELAEALIDINRVSTVTTLALATKLNYWLTNHHVGQGVWASYTLKVVKAIVPELVNDAFKRELHMFCHWFGTHGSLRLFQILTPVCINPLFRDPKTPVMSEDFIVRNDTFPAGTAKITIVDAALRKTRISTLWAACPNLLLLTESVAWVNTPKAAVTAFRQSAHQVGALVPYVRHTNADEPDEAELFTRNMANCDPRVKYHIGADFLAGTKVAHNVSDGTGLIGPVFYYTKKKSTITASPHITRMEGGVSAPAYEGSDSYDDAWDAAIRAYAANPSPVSGKLLIRISGAYQTSISTNAVYTTFMGALDVTQEDVETDYADIQDATVSDDESEQ